MPVLHVHFDALAPALLELHPDEPRRFQQSRPRVLAQVGPSHQPVLPHREQPRQDERPRFVVGAPRIATRHQGLQVLRRQGHLVPLRSLHIQRSDELVREMHHGKIVQLHNFNH